MMINADDTEINAEIRMNYLILACHLNILLSEGNMSKLENAQDVSV